MKKRGGASVKEKTISVIDESKIVQENFTTDFLDYCEENEIQPPPKFVIHDVTESKVSSNLEQSQRTKSSSKSDQQRIGDIEDVYPVFYLTYENPRKFESLRKLECKDNREVSICILDALNSTMQRYNTITVLRLPNCQINAYGIMQIAEMLKNVGSLRDLNLDMNPNVQENYDLLCTPVGNLLYLSLKLCKISDVGVRKIAHELQYQDPPREPKLVALSLANNDITEKGAEYIATMLRTNRSLQSLVLTGNRIRDVGASLIIRELNMSALTHAEIVDLRRRRYTELSQDITLTRENFDGTSDEGRYKKDNKSSKRQSRRFKKSVRQDSSVKTKSTGNSLESISSQRLETLRKVTNRHPFRKESMAMRGSIMSTGNFELQHLNLSFNGLTNETLKNLIACLYYQNYMMLEDSTRGLLHVFLEGNQIQKEGNEDWKTITELLIARRQDESTHNQEDFLNLVPVGSEILREKINESDKKRSNSTKR